MAIDPRYIPAFSIEDVLLDKDTGAPLSGGKVYFERDSQRGILKPIYQITGTSPDYSYTQLPNPVILSSIGTFEDTLGNPVIPYFYPYDGADNIDLYYIRVTSADDVPQFDRQAQPYVFDSGGDQSISGAFENELSNPQFAEVSFDTNTTNYVYNFNAGINQTVSLAPGWDLVVSSSGAATVTVSQTRPAGTLNIPTNPGTLLNINSAGLSSLRLRQRLYGSPNLWGSGGLSGTFVAKTFGGSSVNVSMYYSQSDGSVTNQLIATGSLAASGAYGVFPGSAFIPPSGNTETYPGAYVDIEMDLPLSVNIELTSIMVAATGLVLIRGIQYDQTSHNRQIDNLFHYYKPQLEFKPIPSILTGWDFVDNPAQLLGTSFIINPTAKYGWDQTIVQSVVGDITATRNAVTDGFQATTANNNEAFYMMQYLSGQQAKQILGSRLAVNINAYRTDAGGTVTARVYLCRSSSAGAFPILPTSIGTLAPTGVFTLTASNWTLIPRSNFGQAVGELSVAPNANPSSINDAEDLKFSGWELVDDAQILDTDKFAIVVTFQCPLTGSAIIVNSISLVNGDIPTRPAPQTPEQVLTECEYYYQKSYNSFDVAGSIAGQNSIVSQQNAVINVANVELYTLPFNIAWRTVMRTAPVVNLFSPDSGLGDTVRARTYTGGVLRNNVDISLSSNWSTGALATAVGVKNIYFVPSNASALIPASTGGVTTNPVGSITYHYVADARLGIV